MAGYSNSNGFSNGLASGPFTVTALNRWSVADKQLPAIDKIKVLHVYDFDNTRTLSPYRAPFAYTDFTFSLQQPIT
jgi:hypothetical protein